MSKPRAATIVLVVLAVLVGVLLAAGVCLLAWPNRLNSGYCDVTLHDVSIHADGTATLTVSERYTFGTTLEWTHLPRLNGASGSSRSYSNLHPVFLHWPRELAKFTTRVPLVSLFDGGTDPDLETLRQRFVLQPGKYRLRIGESIVYARVRTRFNTILEGAIRVRPDE